MPGRRDAQLTLLSGLWLASETEYTADGSLAVMGESVSLVSADLLGAWRRGGLSPGLRRIRDRTGRLCRGAHVCAAEARCSWSSSRTTCRFSREEVELLLGERLDSSSAHDDRQQGPAIRAMDA